MKKKIVSILSVLLVSAFPVLFLFFRNAGEAYVSEMIEPMAIYCTTGLICVAVLTLYTNSVIVSALCAFPIVFVFQNYTSIENLLVQVFPSLKWWHILPICLFVLLHISMLIKHFVNEEFAFDVVKIFAVVFSGLILVNVVGAVPTIMEKSNKNTKIKEMQQTESFEEAKETTGPNVYWILFDEYSNFDIVEKYYGYDNSEFGRYLEEKGFAVSYDSINDSQQTMTIIANYASLDYIANDAMTVAERVEIRKTNNQIFSIMRKNGYQLRGIADTVEMFPMEEGQSSNVSSTLEGDTFGSLLIKKTPINCFWPEVHSEKITKIRNGITMFEQPAFYQQQGSFTMWYELLPHQPFVFKRDGSENDIAKWHDWKDPNAYLGSYIYATEVLKTLVDNILKYDPNCIIVLQSDHSARSLQDQNGNYLIDKYDRRHFLNAVYYMGEDISEIKGQSGVNTWRLIMNRLFDMNFSVLEVPVSEYEF